MPAIRLLDTEHQTELAYLHEQLITGEPVQDKSWRYAEEYLMQLGIYNVILVEENDVRNYKRFLLEDRDCTIRAANSMTSFLRNKKAYWIEQEYGDLLEEIRQCEGIEMPLTGNIKNFLIREGIHHIREIDYPIREKYEQYLMKEKKPEQVLRYLKTLDRIKQYHIRQEMKQFANTKKFYLKYEQQILFLPYLPDQKLAMEFDKVRDKTELVWDFSVKPELESLQELSREDIEDYLIYLQTETTERKNYRSDLYGLKRVIEDVGNIYERRHLLELFLNNDFPSTPRYQFKFYSDATIKRLNSHIFNLDEQIARALIVHQLLGTRISDTLTLRMDCLREKEGRYFVRIDQVKSITYEKAVSNEVGRLILKAMEYTKERYGETEYIFVKKDDPSKPYQYGMIQAQVMRMIRQKDIRDDNGELLKFGTHIFRHCYGKKLTELHIEDWMIARLLGHKTLQSVHHYRRIGNKVMADETRKTREKMDLIIMDIIKGWDGYEL